MAKNLVLILNKSKKIIDGIKPLGTASIESNKAELLKSMYGLEIEILANETPLVNEDKDLTIEALRDEYFKAFNKPVPHNMKNNLNWIKKAIANK